MDQASFFSSVYDHITNTMVEHTLDGKSLWANGTDYYDHAVKGEFAPPLMAGEVFKVMTANNRRMIIIGTRFGNVVVFDRYSLDRYAHAKDGVVVCNAPVEVRSFFQGLLNGNLAANDWALSTIFGAMASNGLPDNIGARIERLFKAGTASV